MISKPGAALNFYAFYKDADGDPVTGLTPVVTGSAAGTAFSGTASAIPGMSGWYLYTLDPAETTEQGDYICSFFADSPSVTSKTQVSMWTVVSNLISPTAGNTNLLESIKAICGITNNESDSRITSIALIFEPLIDIQLDSSRLNDEGVAEVVLSAKALIIADAYKISAGLATGEVRSQTVGGVKVEYSSASYSKVMNGTSPLSSLGWSVLAPYMKGLAPETYTAANIPFIPEERSESGVVIRGGNISEWDR